MVPPGFSVVVQFPGKGPDKPVVSTGDLPFERNRDLASTLQWWLTFERLPAPHSGTADGSDIWFCIDHGDLIGVARISIRSPAIGDSGASWGLMRLWRRSDLGAGFDPGTLIGNTDAFALDPQGHPRPLPESHWPSEADLGCLRRQRDAAAGFLGCLLQTRLARQPLVVAADPALLHTGSTLLRLLVVARAALPNSLKPSVRMRFFTVAPDLFLNRESANVLVVPECLAGKAVAARDGVFVVDQDGRPRFQAELRADLQDCARVVIDEALALPSGLLPFSARCWEHTATQDPGSPYRVDRIPLCYRLAQALAQGDEQQLDRVFRLAVFSTAMADSSVPWDQWLSPSDAGRFPAATLQDFLLLDPATLNRGARQLQQIIEQGAQQRGLVVQAGDRTGDDLALLGRLVALAALSPPLIDGSEVAAALGSLDLQRLLDLAPIEQLVASGILVQRLRQAPGSAAAWLRGLAASDDLGRLISAVRTAVGAGGCDPRSWIDALTSTAEPRALMTLVNAIASDGASWADWAPAMPGLVHWLYDTDILSAVERQAMVRLLIERLDPETDPRAFLRLIDLLAESNAATGPANLRSGLFAGTAASVRAALRDAFRTGTWRHLDERVLLGAVGELLVPPDRPLAERLLDDPEMRDTLPLTTLTALARVLEDHRPDIGGLVIEWIDARWVAAGAHPVTSELVTTGVWDFWFRLTHLDREQRRTAALAWLLAPCWQDLRPPEATLEAWRLAMGALTDPGLREADLPGPEHASGPAGALPWPRVRCFEPEQLRDLAAACADPATLARLALVLHRAPLPCELGPVNAFLVSHSRWAQDAHGTLARLPPPTPTANGDHQNTAHASPGGAGSSGLNALLVRLAAILRGAEPGPPPWAELAIALHREPAPAAPNETPGPSRSHPLRQLAAEVGGAGPPTAGSIDLLRGFLAAGARHPELFQPGPAAPGDPCPREIAAVHLAAALMPTLGLGTIGELFLSAMHLPADAEPMHALRGGLANTLHRSPWRHAAERWSVIDAILLKHCGYSLGYGRTGPDLQPAARVTQGSAAPHPATTGKRKPCESP